MRVEQEHGFAAGGLAEGVLGAAGVVEVGEGDDAVVRVGMIVGHDDVLLRQRFFGQVRVEGAELLALHAGQEDVMRVVEQIQPHDHRAAAAQTVGDGAVLAHAHAAAGQIPRGKIELPGPAEAAEKIAQEHHRRAGRAAAAGRTLRAVAVETVEHDIADEVWRDLLAVKEKNDRVHHGDGAAVVFRHLIMQRGLHRASLPDQRFGELRRTGEFVHAGVFLAAVAAVHARGHNEPLQAMQAEMVVVAAAVGHGHAGFEPCAGAGTEKQLRRLARRVDPVGLAEDLARKLHRAALRRGRVLHDRFDLAELLQGERVIEAAHLAGHGAAVRDDVVRRAARDRADVDGQLAHAAAGDLRRGLCCSADGVPPLLRREGRVRGPAGKHGAKREDARRLIRRAADRPAEVKDIGELRAQAGKIKPLDAGAVALLRGVEQKLKRPVRRAVLKHGGHGLENGALACQIVRAEHGRAVGGDAAVRMEDGALAAGGRDGVRMRREQDRRKRLVPGDEGIKIPGIAADGSSGPVLLQPDAERGIAPQQMIAHAALAQRRIVDRNQLPERPQKPLLPDHTDHPFIPHDFTGITQHHSHLRRTSQAG